MSRASLAQAREILDLLAGSSSTEVQRLIEAGDLLKLIMKYGAQHVDRESFEHALQPSTQPFSELFRTTPEVFQEFVARNKQRDWGFGNEAINELRGQFIEHSSSLSRCITLDIWLGDLQTTFEELWAWVADAHGADGTWRYEGLHSDAQNLRLAHSLRSSSEPSVRWVAVDLAANSSRGFVHEPIKGAAGLELLTTAAIHRMWVRAIDHNVIPAVDMAGLQARMYPGSDSWAGCPYLTWDGVKLTLNLGISPTLRHPRGYAVPVAIDL